MKRFKSLTGQGVHVLRFDEWPNYLKQLAIHYGPGSAEFADAANWLANELKRKTNDERVLANKLSALMERENQGAPE